MLRAATSLTVLFLFAACNDGQSATSVALPPGDAADGGFVPAADAGADETEEPSLEEPAPFAIDEEVEASLPLRSKAIRRFDAEGLPPGARIDRRTGTITFRPDFTQSGVYEIRVTAYGGGASARFTKQVTVKLTVNDTVAPPAPVVVSSTPVAGGTRLLVRQTTDAFLDSTGHAGRTFDAIVVVPSAASETAPAPVTIALHGFGGAPNANATSSTTFRIEPHDPDNTYWWGYGAGLPGPTPTTGHVHPYTIRRVVHLLSWLLRTYPSADPDRVFATGGSMGGAGALTLGLLHARHFAGIEATIAQAIPRNHRPSRITQLTTLWGAPATNLDGTWDEIDLTRVMRDVPEARDQYVFTKHGKDDPTIHFGAVLYASPLTKKSFYRALEDEHIGHLSVWDEGAHGPADPVLGARWWDAGWSRISDAKSYLTRRAPFPAFSRSQANEDPGNGNGNGKVPYSAESGYAAKVAVAGDTGWKGALAGALNRHLRWDTPAIVDTRDRLVMPLHIVAAPGDAAPAEGYPTKRDLYTGDVPLVVDVTPRRTRTFRPLDGESVRWRFGPLEGTATAAADGSVTVPALPVTTTPTALELERDPP